MGTIMYDTVHIKIQAIELWNSILRNQLGDGGIPLAHPPEEFGDPHAGYRVVLLERQSLI